jgi:hypothetical protein
VHKASEPDDLTAEDRDKSCRDRAALSPRPEASDAIGDAQMGRDGSPFFMVPRARAGIVSRCSVRYSISRAMLGSYGLTPGYLQSPRPFDVNLGFVSFIHLFDGSTTLISTFQ